MGQHLTALHYRVCVPTRQVTPDVRGRAAHTADPNRDTTPSCCRGVIVEEAAAKKRAGERGGGQKAEPICVCFCHVTGNNANFRVLLSRLFLVSPGL